MPSRSSQSQGALSARPQVPVPSSVPCEPGVYALELGDTIRDGRLYLPRGPENQPRPLLVLLHGAGADGSSMLRMAGAVATRHDVVLLAPDARKHTWDFLIRGFGPDVSFLDDALKATFERCSIEPSKIAVSGFSDGASYALTLGLANGDLFTHVIAFSPGFMRPPRIVGSPPIYVSHGRADEVLPIDRCSRRIVPQLEAGGYEVRYVEFDGPHTVPEEILSEAMRWFLGERDREVE